MEVALSLSLDEIHCERLNSFFSLRFNQYGKAGMTPADTTKK